VSRTARWLAASVTVLAIAVFWIAWRFNSDIQAAQASAAQGSMLVNTRCGPIEYQEAGVGPPLLMVHGSGGGHDQGMAFAGNLWCSAAYA
jgi:2-hydroxy-6-oxonona-2,4-dienedioate hydrolase